MKGPPPPDIPTLVAPTGTVVTRTPTYTWKEVATATEYFQQKSVEAIVSIFGVLKAGLTYVPIDVQSPAARVTKIVQTSEPRCVLVDPAGVSLLDQVLFEAGARSPWVVAMAKGPLEGEHFRSRSDLRQLGGLPTERPALARPTPTLSTSSLRPDRPARHRGS